MDVFLRRRQSGRKLIVWLWNKLTILAVRTVGRLTGAARDVAAHFAVTGWWNWPDQGNHLWNPPRRELETPQTCLSPNPPNGTVATAEREMRSMDVSLISAVAALLPKSLYLTRAFRPGF